MFLPENIILYPMSGEVFLMQQSRNFHDTLRV
jgi:hypothetical protein